MRKEIPVNIVEDNEDVIETYDPYDNEDEENKKENKTIEYIVYAFIWLIVIFIFSLLFSDWFDIEKERNKILENEAIKLEMTKKEREKLTDKLRIVILTEKQIEKCIELNSNTGAIADCDLIFNKEIWK